MSGVELFAIGSTAVTLGDAALVAGTLISAAGAVSQGQQQKRLAQYNAQVAEVDAANTRAWAGYEEERLRKRSAALRGSQRNVFGAAGQTEGAPLLLMAEAAQVEEMDALALRYSASVQEAKSRSQASLDRMSGNFAARNAYTSGFGTLLTGTSRLADRFTQRLGDPAVPAAAGG